MEEHSLVILEDENKKVIVDYFVQMLSSWMNIFVLMNKNVFVLATKILEHQIILFNVFIFCQICCLNLAFQNCPLLDNIPSLQIPTVKVRQHLIECSKIEFGLSGICKIIMDNYKYK